MTVDDRHVRPPRFRVSLQLAVSLLLIGTVVAVGVVVGLYNYCSDVADRARGCGRRLPADGTGGDARAWPQRRPVRTLVDVFAQQRIGEASTLDDRLAELPAYTEALRKNPALTALYVGYDDGGFFLVRLIRDEVTRAALKAPPTPPSSCRASSGRKAVRLP